MLCYVMLGILRKPTHHKTTRPFFEQRPPADGDAGQVDEGGHGSVQ